MTEGSPAPPPGAPAAPDPEAPARPPGLLLAAAYLLFTSVGAAAAMAMVLRGEIAASPDTPDLRALPAPVLSLMLGVLVANVLGGALLLLKRKAALAFLFLSLALNVASLFFGASIGVAWLIYLAVTGYALTLVRRGVLR